MSYGNTQGMSGNGTLVYVFGTGTLVAGVWTWTPSSGSPGSGSTGWTLIGECGDFNQSGSKMETDEATNLQSLAVEKIPTIVDEGGFSGAWNRISNDGGQIAVRAAYHTVPPSALFLKVAIRKAPFQATSGDVLVFAAIPTEINNLGTLNPKKKISTPFKFEVTGQITEYPGS